MMFKHRVTIQNWFKEGDNFKKDTVDAYEISYLQINKDTFQVFVNGYNTYMKITLQSTFPYRKRIAEAINLYKKMNNIMLGHVLSITKFEDRDEQTQLGLYKEPKTTE